MTFSLVLHLPTNLCIFSDKVCDTIYDMEEIKKQRDECIHVPSLVCTTEEKTVHEKV